MKTSDKIEHLEKLHGEWEQKVEDFVAFVHGSRDWIARNINEDEYRFIGYTEALKNLDGALCGLSVFEFLIDKLKETDLDEIAEQGHHIRMTDDPHYRDAWNKAHKQKEIDEYGIDE